MGLISYEQLEDDVDATANLFNERFAKIYNEFNGNITAANLTNGAVTTPKIADGAVTSAKLALDFYTDDNGWDVFEYGGFTTYKKIVTHEGSNFTITPGEVDYTMFTTPGPVGVTPTTSNTQITQILLWGATTWSFVYKGDQFSVNGDNEIVLSGHVHNQTGSNQGIWFKYAIEITV